MPGVMDENRKIWNSGTSGRCAGNYGLLAPKRQSIKPGTMVVIAPYDSNRFGEGPIPADDRAAAAIAGRR